MTHKILGAAYLHWAVPAIMLAAACNRPSALAASAPTPTLQASAPAEPAAPIPTRRANVCSDFSSEQRALGLQWPEGAEVPSVLGECYATRGGAWTLYMDSLRVDPDELRLTARFTVAHFSLGSSLPSRSDAPFIPSPLAGLPEAPSFPPTANYVIEGAHYQTDLFTPTTFDYDGDGEAELIFAMEAYVVEGVTSAHAGYVFTFKNGEVLGYRPADGLAWRDCEDVDGDGRPDLLGSYLSVPVMYHALADGTFSATDAVAVAYAERACPPNRRAVFLPVKDPASGETGWNGGCARLWGATEQQVVDEIDRHCRPDHPNICLFKNVINDRITESPATYRSDAKLPPPLLLAPPNHVP